MTRLPPLLLAIAVLAACGGAAPAPVKLKSVKVELPAEEAFFEGAGADTLNANCTACHSAEMVMHQPDLTEAQWTATVTKMREVYKAPIEEGDVPQIAAALVALRRDADQ